MEEFKYKVYVKLDKNNCIIAVESDLTLEDIKGYVQIDEGLGDKYSHAQGNYLEKPLRDLQSRCNYKYIYNKVVELTEEEKELLFPTEQPKATEQQVLNAQLLQQNANLQLEMQQQKQLNAQMLLQLASLGGNGNV